MNEQIENAIKQILITIGENPQREGLIKTPSRVSKALLELTSGLKTTPKDVVKDGIFQTDSTGMVSQNNIEFSSLCEHHLLPFFGVVHIAYLPNNKIIGLSKLGRLVDVFAKRLQVQEHFTKQIADALTELLHPRGVAVCIEAKHMCMIMRGVKKQNSQTITTEFQGQFSTDFHQQKIFLQMLKA